MIRIMVEHVTMSRVKSRDYVIFICEATGGMAWIHSETYIPNAFPVPPSDSEKGREFTGLNKSPKIAHFGFKCNKEDYLSLWV
jgi:hypothetical protein